jgi:hypothetical protein
MPYSLLSRFRGALIGGVVDQRQPRYRCADLTDVEAVAATVQSLVTGQYSAVVKTEIEILSLVPVALYLHDDHQKLRQIILEAIPVGLEDAGVAIATAITFALRPQVDPLRVLPELVQSLSDSGLSQKLQQVQNFLVRRDSLAIALQTLGDPNQLEIALAVAFYCWLSTATQFQLSLRRVQSIPDVSPLTLGLTGALSGALNGQSAIPTPWLTSQASTLKAMETLADQLLAAWAGCYSVATKDAMGDQRWSHGNVANLTAIASPGILHPR